LVYLWQAVLFLIFESEVRASNNQKQNALSDRVTAALAGGAAADQIARQRMQTEIVGSVISFEKGCRHARRGMVPNSSTSWQAAPMPRSVYFKVTLGFVAYRSNQLAFELHFSVITERHK
jgi:hypothetical protein